MKKDLELVQVYAIVGEVLVQLKTKGYSLSIDQEFRLFTLLNHFQHEVPSDQLPLFFTPILASNNENQETVYACFNEAILLVTSGKYSPPPLPSSIKDKKKPISYYFFPWLLSIINHVLFLFSNVSTLKFLKKRIKDHFRAELQSFEKPPFVWNIDLNAEYEFFRAIKLRHLVNQMHIRELLQAQELDVFRTIESSINQPGSISLHYRQITQAPSYLLLIDQRSQQDHRAKVFNLLYENFKFNEIRINRFYFNATPKLCFNEDFPYGVPIAQLYSEYKNARLLMLSFGHELLSPINNDWLNWTSVFSQWSQKVILSPLATQKWGPLESKLAEKFSLFPATLQGLAYAIETFKLDKKEHWEDYLIQISDAPAEPVYYQNDLIETLECYFPNLYVRKWIAACAFYPVLHWELTLHLGTLLEKKFNTSSLVSIENILELAQLPWFIEGKIPDAARDELIQWLERIGEEAAIRNLLLESLNQAPAPPKDSSAYADYRMQLVFNQWMLEKNKKLKAKLEDEFSHYLKMMGRSPDFVTFKRLERGHKRTEFIIPEKWSATIAVEQVTPKEKPKSNEKVEGLRTTLSRTHIKELVADGKVDMAVDKLEEFLLPRIDEYSPLYRAALKAQREFNQIKEKELQGLLTEDQIRLANNNAIIKVLEILEQLDRGVTKPARQTFQLFNIFRNSNPRGKTGNSEIASYEIKTYLAEGDIDFALNKLLEFLSTRIDEYGPLYRAAKVAQSEYNRIKERELQGLLTEDQIRLSNNLTIEKILGIIEQIGRGPEQSRGFVARLVDFLWQSPINEKPALNFRDEIRTLIAKGKTYEALDRLVKFSSIHQNDNPTFYDSAILLQAQFMHLQDAILTGALSFDRINVETIKIAKQVLEMLDLIEVGVNPIKSKNLPSTTKLSNSPISEIYRFIAEGQTAEALKALMELLEMQNNQDLLQQVIMLSSQFYMLQTDMNKNIIDHHDFVRNRNRVLASLIGILKQIEGQGNAIISESRLRIPWYLRIFNRR